ncbi:MAG: DUF1080 domain-containing protein [Gammaproteobacteria bacterium]|nr:DUF1080 domain-containing protein [Gammaproteobacteria bacterium]
METRTTPPPNARVLFAGKAAADWESRNGGPPQWKVEGGFLEVLPGTGDIMTRATFRDAFLHLEFRCPDMPRAKGQDKANSGVYLQGRYELQILDSWGVKKPGPRDCGAVYSVAAPLVNAAKAPSTWQTFEVVFRAPRETAQGNDAARITVFLNGLVIHNNLALPAPTPGALDEDLLAPGPLLLQDHGSPVAFRRIWIVPLAEG